MEYDEFGDEIGDLTDIFGDEEIYGNVHRTKMRRKSEKRIYSCNI